MANDSNIFRLLPPIHSDQTGVDDRTNPPIVISPASEPDIPIPDIITLDPDVAPLLPKKTEERNPYLDALLARSEEAPDSGMVGGPQPGPPLRSKSNGRDSFPKILGPNIEAMIEGATTSPTPLEKTIYGDPERKYNWRKIEGGIRHPSMDRVEQQDRVISEFTGSFYQGLVEENPEMMGNAFDAFGASTGTESLRNFGSVIIEAVDGGGGDFVPQVGMFTHVEDAEDALLFMAQGLGQGLSSIAIPIAGGVVGAVAFGVPSGGILAAPGAIIGAASGSILLNTGETWATIKSDKDIKALIDSGEMSEQYAASIAIAAGLAMGALDAGGALKVVGAPLLFKIKSDIKKTIIRKMIDGTLIEGGTEMLQSVFKQIAEIHLGSQKELKERVLETINEGIIGAMTGGVVSGGTAGIDYLPKSNIDPPPRPGPEDAIARALLDPTLQRPGNIEVELISEEDFNNLTQDIPPVDAERVATEISVDITDPVYDTLWTQLQNGETQNGDGDINTFLQLAQRIRLRGGILSKGELRQVGDHYREFWEAFKGDNAKWQRDLDRFIVLHSPPPDVASDVASVTPGFPSGLGPVLPKTPEEAKTKTVQDVAEATGASVEEAGAAVDIAEEPDRRDLPDALFDGDREISLTEIFSDSEAAGPPVQLQDHGFTSDEITTMTDAGLSSQDGQMTREQFVSWIAERTRRVLAKRPLGESSAIDPQFAASAVFHGYGREDKGSVYGAGEDGVPILGNAGYFAFTKEGAAEFGPNTIETTVSGEVENPLIIRSGDQWRSLAKVAGWEFPNLFGQPPETVQKQIDSMRQLIESRGHDGVIVWWDDSIEGDFNSEGDDIKILRNVFGSPQLVSFNDRASSANSVDQAVKDAEVIATTPIPVVTPDIAAGLESKSGEPIGPVMINATHLTRDPIRFQFKSNTNIDGVNQKLLDVQFWDTFRGGMIGVWQALDGTMYVADGHQRLALAERLLADGTEQNIEMTSIIWREADGFTAKDAMVLAAMKNIIAGSADLVDAARVLRHEPGFLDQIRQIGEANTRHVVGLTGLSDEVWMMAVNNVNDSFPAAYAGAIGRMIKGDPIRQLAAAKEITRIKPSSQLKAEILIQMVKDAALAKREGDAQGDIFGGRDIAESTAREQMEIQAGAIRILSRDKNVLKSGARNKAILEGIPETIISKEAMITESDKINQLLVEIRSVSRSHGDVHDALVELATEVKRGNISLTGSGGAIDLFITAFKESESIITPRSHEVGQDGPAASSSDEDSQAQNPPDAPITKDPVEEAEAPSPGDGSSFPSNILTGMVLVSESGRSLDPVPFVDFSTEEGRADAKIALDRWLWLEALEEGESLQDDFPESIEDMAPLDLSREDRDLLNAVVFGRLSGPHSGSTVESEIDQDGVDTRAANRLDEITRVLGARGITKAVNDLSEDLPIMSRGELVDAARGAKNLEQALTDLGLEEEEETTLRDILAEDPPSSESPISDENIFSVVESENLLRLLNQKIIELDASEISAEDENSGGAEEDAPNAVGLYPRGSAESNRLIADLNEIATLWREAGSPDRAQGIEDRIKNQKMLFNGALVEYERNLYTQHLRQSNGAPLLDSEVGDYSLKRFFMDDKPLEKNWADIQKIAKDDPEVMDRLARVDAAIKAIVSVINDSGFKVAEIRGDMGTAALSGIRKNMSGVAGATSRWMKSLIADAGYKRRGTKPRKGRHVDDWVAVEEILAESAGQLSGRAPLPGWIGLPDKPVTSAEDGQAYIDRVLGDKWVFKAAKPGEDLELYPNDSDGNPIEDQLISIRNTWRDLEAAVNPLKAAQSEEAVHRGVPSFVEAVALIPRDANGDFDSAGLVEIIKRITGRNSWNALDDTEKSFVRDSLLEEPPADAVDSLIEQDENNPIREELSTDTTPSAGRLAQIFGASLYNGMDELQSISVKEMFQNSFDAVKASIENGDIKKGQIAINFNEYDRTIELIDNGSGMTGEVLSGPFLQIAGTNKESKRSSGGFGVAKMLFLYENRTIKVTTLRDGLVSELVTTGEQLLASLEDKTLMPKVTRETVNEYSGVMQDIGINRLFPDGHGTRIEVAVPEIYPDPDDPDGKDKYIRFMTRPVDHDSIIGSPLLADIDVVIDGVQVENTGSTFKQDDYTQFADVEFGWGTARILVSKEQRSPNWKGNVSVLSNGLWQFDDTIPKDPNQPFGDKIQRDFFIDVASKVGPEESGYPFDRDRQGFSKRTKEDLTAIYIYISQLYKREDFVDESRSFGQFEYLDPDDVGAVRSSGSQTLSPPAPPTPSAASTINAGDQIVVEDGVLKVNGREVPRLTREDLKKTEINFDEFNIPQDQIDPSRIMLHDNLIVSEIPYSQRGTDFPVAEPLPGDTGSSDNNDFLGNFVNKLNPFSNNKTSNEAFSIGENIKLNKPTPLSELARMRFGDRFDNFAFGVGDVFKELRNQVIELMSVPEIEGKARFDYKAMANEAVGISFDEAYRGVSIKVPFSGMFINIAAPEFRDPLRAALGYYHTMIHELAHYQVRNHGAEFPAEMQRELIQIVAQRIEGGIDETIISDLIEKLIAVTKDHQDVLNFLIEVQNDGTFTEIGNSFKDDSSNEAADGRNAGDLARLRETADSDGPDLPSESDKTEGAPEAEQGSGNIPSESQGNAPGLTTEIGADGLPQTEIPGTQRETKTQTKARLDRQAADRRREQAKLQPKVPQKSAGPLFVDNNEYQVDIEDLLNEIDGGNRYTQSLAGRGLFGDRPRRAAGIAADPSAPIAENIRSLVDKLAALMGVPLRQGRIPAGGRGQTLGIYKHSGVVRLKKLEAFEVFAHESGHTLMFLRKENQTAIDRIIELHSAEVEALAYPGTRQGQERVEGFAEFFRLWITNRPFAIQAAPNFAPEFDHWLQRAHPDLFADLNTLTQDYSRFLDTGSTKAVIATVVYSRKNMWQRSKLVAKNMKNELTPAGETLFTLWGRRYTEIVNEQHPITAWLKTAEKVFDKNHPGQRLDVSPAADPVIEARLALSAHQGGHIDLRYGVVPFGRSDPVGVALAAAFEHALGKSAMGSWRADDTLAFDAYLVARRMEFLWRRRKDGKLENVPGSLTHGDYLVAIKELEEKYPTFKRASEMVYEWNRNLLQKKMDAGVITIEYYEASIDGENYVPLIREFAEKEFDSAINSIEPGGNSRQNIMKALRGSMRNVIAPSETMVQQAYATNALIARNNVFVSMHHLARRAGSGAAAIWETVPLKEIQGIKVELVEILQSIGKEAGLDKASIQDLILLAEEAIGDEQVSTTIYRAKLAKLKAEPIIFYYINGEQFAARLPDSKFGKTLYESLTMVGTSNQMNWFLEWLTVPASLLRTSVTTDPMYQLFNFTRDQVMAGWMNPKYIPFISGMRGIYDELRGTKWARLYAQYGGMMGGVNVATLNQSRLKKDLNAIRKKKISFRHIRDITAFLKFTEITETGTRIALFRQYYKTAIRQGLSEHEALKEAAFEARDFMDFGRHGSRMLHARRMTTFMNSAIQGSDKEARIAFVDLLPLARVISGEKLTRREGNALKRSILSWAKLAVATHLVVAYVIMNQDDEEWQQFSPYMRATLWLVKVGDHWVGIPKPFGFLTVMLNLGERFTEGKINNDPKWADKWWDSIGKTADIPLDPTFLKAPLEIFFNYNSFTKRPIVPDNIKNPKHPWLEYNEYTWEIAKMMGNATGMSPMKIQHTLTSFGASWARNIGRYTDMVINPRKVSDELYDWPMLNRVFRNPDRGARSRQEFWDQVGDTTGELSNAKRSFEQHRTKEHDFRKATEIFKKLEEDEKLWVLTTRLGSADEKNVHPLHNASEMLGILSGLRRNSANDTLISSFTGESIEINPNRVTTLNDQLSRISGAETRNALIAIGSPGWVGREHQDVTPLYDRLRDISPEVADEVELSYDKVGVLPSAGVAATWPKFKEELLRAGLGPDLSEDTSEANVSLLVFDAEQHRNSGRTRDRLESAEPSQPFAP